MFSTFRIVPLDEKINTPTAEICPMSFRGAPIGLKFENIVFFSGKNNHSSFRHHVTSVEC